MEQREVKTEQQTTLKEDGNEIREEIREENRDGQSTSKNNEHKRSKDEDSERKKEEFSESRSNSPQDNELDNSTVFSVPKRYILAIMMFAGFMNMYAIRVNLNVAIGAMVKPHPVVEKGRHYIKVIT